MIDEKELYNRALAFAQTNSYSPYSSIKVGAAAMLSNGEIVCGANLENSSFPVSICAEQSMLCTINNHYHDVKVEMIAVAALKDGENFAISPCGMCRQMLLECQMRQEKEIKIIFLHSGELCIVESVAKLLPYAFSL